MTTVAGVLALLPATASGAPSPGRHLELATPPEKLGQPVRLARISPDGTTIMFDTTGGNGLPGTGSHGVVGNAYVARREGGSWQYRPMNLSSQHVRYPLLHDASKSLGVELSSAVVETTSEATALFTRAVGGDPKQVSTAIVNRAGPQASSRPQYRGASSDFTHVVLAAGPFGAFEAENAYLASDPPRLTDRSSPGKLYEAVSGASPLLRRVDVDTAGSPVATCGTVALGGALGAERAVSDDGQRILFSAPTDCTDADAPGPSHLFARVGGATTVDVSASECDRTPGPSVPACEPPAATADYASASADGSRVLFTTTDQLTDSDTDATTDLYCYDSAAPVGQRMTQVSAGAPAGAGAEVAGVVRTAADGGRVTFVARGLLAGSNAAGAAPVAGGDNLYVADLDSGTTTFVATLDPGDGALYGQDSNRPAQLADDAGRYLLFDSAGALTADDTDAALDLYRYDAVADDLRRISVAEDPVEDAVPVIPLRTVDNSVSGQAGATAYRRISRDGSRIVFATTAALRPDDQNATPDVYEWHDGQIDRVTDVRDPIGVGGQFATNTGFLLSEDGSTVAFSTADRLLPDRDTDTAADVYVARLGSDVDPLPAVPATGCDGAACGGPVPPALGIPAPGTPTFRGPTTAADPPPVARTPRPRLRAPSAVRGARFTVRVAVSGKGRLTVSGRGVASVTKVVTRSGTYRLTMRLTGAVRQAWRRGRTGTVRVRASFRSPGARASTTTAAVEVRPATKRKARS